MVTKKEDIKLRKDRVLGIVVDQYILTISPVSSAYIVKTHQLDLSSATIRNTLAELEYEGFLTHPHTSAGRVPTQKGYRYYVDHLMNEIQLLEDEKRNIKAEYEIEKLELDSLLDKTSQILSNVTHYTSIVSIDGVGNKIYCSGTSYVVGYPEYSNIEEIRQILLALEEKERLLEIINRGLDERVSILIGRELEEARINSCSLVVSCYRSNKGATGKIAILGPTYMDYKKVVSALEYCTDLMEEVI